MYKVGDKVRVISVDTFDDIKGITIGDMFIIKSVDNEGKHVYVDFTNNSSIPLYSNQIELVQISPPTQFNFITKRQIAEHLQNVIEFYEEYTSDLLKESSRDYKENIIDLKETGYEFRLELDKILIQVEEELV